jgi:hypothetical protein
VAIQEKSGLELFFLDLDGTEVLLLFLHILDIKVQVVEGGLGEIRQVDIDPVPVLVELDGGVLLEDFEDLDMLNLVHTFDDGFHGVELFLFGGDFGMSGG